MFDCAAVYKGVSLNSVLLSGPDLTSNLVTVLLKFRQDYIAVMSDVESMFYQVKAAKEDCDCLLFLWWPGGDLSQDPVIYRMLVHLFGASLSPSCANFALRQTAEYYDKHVTSAVTESFQNNFYVDDFLKSVSTEEEAITLVSAIRKLCEIGGFHLVVQFNDAGEQQSICTGQYTSGGKSQMSISS